MENKGKKRVVILSTFFYPYLSGGAEQMAFETAKRISGQYDVFVVTARVARKLPRMEEKDGYTIVRVGIGNHNFDKYLNPILSSLKTAALKPDLVHAVMESFAGIALVFLRFLSPKARRVLSLQCGNLDVRMPFFLSLFWKPVHAYPHKVLPISNFLAERARGLGVKSENIRIIPNGVDLESIPVGTIKEADRVVCVARLSWEKGHEYLINAWPEIVKTVPTARLFLVGDGLKRKDIEAMVSSLGIGGSVTLMGDQKHDKVLEAIGRSEVFVCPSLAEGLGIVFIEAQACGLAPIGTEVGGIPDIIQNEENGLLIEARSASAISQAVIRLLKDKELNRKLSERAKETVKRYDWDSITSAINDVYEGLLD